MADLLYVGLDISLDATGICFRYQGKCHYASLVNLRKLDGSKNPGLPRILELHPYVGELRKLPVVSIGFWDRAIVPTVAACGLDVWQRTHMLNCLNGQDRLIELLDRLTATLYPDVPAHHRVVAFENYSYGSVTDNFIQVVEATVLIKAALLRAGYVTAANLRIIPGPKIKMMAGSGALDKWGMMQAFLCDHCRDGDPTQDLLREYLVEAADRVTRPQVKNPKKGVVEVLQKNGKPKKGTVPVYTREVKPIISDIIDAYFLALYAERYPEFNTPTPKKKKAPKKI